MDDQRYAHGAKLPARQFGAMCACRCGQLVAIYFGIVDAALFEDGAAPQHHTASAAAGRTLPFIDFKAGFAVDVLQLAGNACLQTFQIIANAFDLHQRVPLTMLPLRKNFIVLGLPLPAGNPLTIKSSSSPNCLRSCSELRTVARPARFALVDTIGACSRSHKICIKGCPVILIATVEKLPRIQIGQNLLAGTSQLVGAAPGEQIGLS